MCILIAILSLNVVLDQIVMDGKMNKINKSSFRIFDCLTRNLISNNIAVNDTK